MKLECPFSLRMPFDYRFRYIFFVDNLKIVCYSDFLLSYHSEFLLLSRLILFKSENMVITFPIFAIIPSYDLHDLI